MEARNLSSRCSHVWLLVRALLFSCFIFWPFSHIIFLLYLLALFSHGLSSVVHGQNSGSSSAFYKGTIPIRLNSHHYNFIHKFNYLLMSFTAGLVGKESAYNAVDVSLIPGWERSPRKGNSNSLQYSCLGNPMDRGAWRATVPGVEKVGHN